MEETDPRMSGMFELDAPPAPPPPQPVGVYGWRKRCLYACIVVLMISVVVNLALTVWILRVLDFSWDGMGRLKLNPGGFTLKGEAEFLKTVYVNKLRNKEKPLYIHSNKKVQLSSSKQNSTERSRILIGK
ncbi:zeta-sarcoglycan [Elysia marginata]|uniref:Zeta-sarcoglycan n=1 Tax=Elysia marginata TaxID=1093978 RepID=A0AAV4I0F6_9GAST|nr:zeta-sarcoglycan [Elysia marginata]